MYCENLLVEIKQNLRLEYRVQFFYANYKLIYEFKKSFGVSNEDFEDFSQLCYKGFLKAIDAYDFSSKFPFISFYRKCARHEYFLWKLEMKYPCRIPVNKYEKVKDRYRTIAIDRLTEDDLDSVYSNLCDELIEVEDSLIAASLWSCVRNSLDYFEFIVVYSNYKKDKSLRSIAVECNTTFRDVKTTHQRALRKLHRVQEIRDIAVEIYGIKV